MASAVKEAPSGSVSTTLTVLQEYHHSAPLKTLVQRSLYLDQSSLPSRIKETWGSLIEKFQTFSLCDDPLKAINEVFFKYIKKHHPKTATPDEFLWSYRGIQLRVPVPIQKEINPVFGSGTFIVEDERLVCAIENDKYFINGEHLLVKGKPLDEGDVVCSKRDSKTFEPYFVVGKQGTICLITKERYVPPANEKSLMQTQAYLKKLSFLENEPVKRAEFLEPFKEGTIFSPYFFVASSIEMKEGVKTAPTDKQIMISLENDKILASLLNYFKLEFEEMRYTDQQKMVRLFQFVYFAIKEPPKEFTIPPHTYYLGEFLRFGYGKCFHKALLFKILADHFGLKASMQAAYIPLAHAWNVVKIKGDYYFADTAKGGFFPLPNPSSVKQMT